MNNGYSRYIGAFPGNSVAVRWCDWTSFQKLCPQETGGAILDCWTVLPGIVSFECASGYTIVADGVCVQKPSREDRYCSRRFGGNTTMSVANPIMLNSGAKYEHDVDFSTADGRFKIERIYRSTPQITDNGIFRTPVIGSVEGWRFGFSFEFHLNDGITLDGSAAGAVYASDGTAYRFERNGNVFSAPYGYPTDFKLEFVGTPPSDWNSIFSSPSQWKVTEPTGRVWILQTQSRLNQSLVRYTIARPVQIIERDGYSTFISYGSLNEINTISDSFGRQANLTWQYFNITTVTGVADTSPLPEAVKDISLPDGTSIRYTYDVAPSVGASSARVSQLKKVEYLDTGSQIIDSKTYHYEDTRFKTFLTGITDGRGIRYSTYAYDGQGRASSSEHAGGAERYTVSYVPVSFSLFDRVVTNPLGKSATYHYDYDAVYRDTLISSIEGAASTNCPSSTRSYNYSSSLISKETDEEGRVVAYTRDGDGRPLTITRGFGTPSAATTTMTWNTSLNVPSQVVEAGLTTDYVWNAQGQLTSHTQTDTTSHTVPYSTSGQARTWTYTYGTGGLLASVDGPLAGTGDTTSYTYDAQGYLKTIANEVGHVTTVDTVNGRGQPTLVTDPNGVKTAMSYDGRGRLLTVTQDSTGTPSATTLEYDGTGQITKVTQPNGSWLSFTYDGTRRLTTVTNNAGETTNYVRDAMGGATSITRKTWNGTTTFTRTQAFDELGRLLRGIGASSSVWQFGYDKTDNLVAVTDPRSNLYNYGFDALNRLISETNEDSEQSQVTRNGVDAVTSYKDPRNLTTSYVRNGFGEIIQASSPDSGTVVYQRDARGLITQKTDGRSVVTNQSFDDAGRMTTRTFPSDTGLNIAWSYDDITGSNKGKGRLTGMSDASGTTAWVYDARGNVLSETRVIAGKSYVVAYAYDLADKVTQITYPSGRILTFGRDMTGRVGNVSTKQSAAAASAAVASNIAYQPFGDLQTLSYGNGLSLWRTFDQNDAPHLFLVEDLASGTALIKRFNGYDDNGLNLTKIDNYDDVSPSAHQNYWYAPTRRLQYASGAWGELTYFYGLGGNRTYEIETQGGVTTERVTGYPANSNRMALVTTNGALSRSFGHDDAGNLVSDTQGGSTWAFTHNAAGRLSQASVGGLLKGTYTYDGLERLAIRAVSNTTPSGTTHLIYDTAGHLLAEANATSGATMREYVWLEIEDLGADSGPTRRPGNDNDRSGAGGQLGAAENDNDPTALAQLPSLNGPKRGIASRAVPLAVVADVDTASPKTLYVHADHLDRPVRMTDAAKALVWDAIYRPYGAVQSITGSASLDARFPGQWFQLETGLHHNSHRTYDPTTGRYLQPDPLGFVDGPSVYSYAANSPLMNSDRAGLLSNSAGATIRSLSGSPSFSGISRIAKSSPFFCQNVDCGAPTGGTTKPLCPDCATKLKNGMPVILENGKILRPGTNLFPGGRQ